MNREDLKKWLNEQISYLKKTKANPDKFTWDPEYDYQLAAFRLALERLEPAEPLTLEQLREMDGQKVLLYRMKSTEPLEPGTVKQNGDVLGDAGMLAYHELYLETWVAFTYHPAHIDREAWELCELCEKQRKVFNEDFCGNCGRPLTPETCAELEKRLRG